MPDRSEPRGGKPAGGGRGGTPRTGGAKGARSGSTGGRPSSGTPRAGGGDARSGTGRSGTPRTSSGGASASRGTGGASASRGTAGARGDSARSGAPRPGASRGDGPRTGGARADVPRAGGSRPSDAAPRAPRAGAPAGRGSQSGASTGRPRAGGADRTTGRDRTGDRPDRATDRTSERAPRAGARTGTGRPASGGARPPRTGGPGAPGRYAREDRPARPVGPPLPPDADPQLLPREVRRELKGIPDPTVEVIAAHLVAAGRLVDDDPAAAYEHTKFAKTMASRVGAVREAVGVTAYRAGDYAAALTELKAARRITGLPDHLPLLADCERALGHPDKALAYGNDPDRAKLDRATQVELAIVLSGARRDLGQPDAAVLALQGPELDSDAVEPWTPRLWYAYADALLAAGRRDDAESWFNAVAAIDEDGETDAEERLAEL